MVFLCILLTSLENQQSYNGREGEGGVPLLWINEHKEKGWLNAWPAAWPKSTC